MNKVDARIIDFFDRHVTNYIIDKYGMNDREALRSFLESETYQMLIEADLDIYTMSPAVVFDMWESEKITGNPRNSRYIRE